MVRIITTLWMKPVVAVTSAQTRVPNLPVENSLGFALLVKQVALAVGNTCTNIFTKWSGQPVRLRFRY
jgi:hypothetical protein